MDRTLLSWYQRADSGYKLLPRIRNKVRESQSGPEKHRYTDVGENLKGLHSRFDRYSVGELLR